MPARVLDAGVAKDFQTLATRVIHEERRHAVVGGEIAGGKQLAVALVVCERELRRAHDAQKSRLRVRRACRMDWDWGDWVSQQLGEVAKAILCCLASGENLMVLVPRLGGSRSALQHHKERLARLIHDWLGADLLCQVQERPAWLNTVHATLQRMACRWERQATGPATLPDFVL